MACIYGQVQRLLLAISIYNYLLQADLTTFNNSWYRPGGAVKRLLWLCVSAAFFRHSLAVFNGLKCSLLRLFGARIGKGVLIKPSVHIKYPWFLEIGDHCWIGEGVWIDNLAKITLGNNVCLSQGAYLLTGNHDYTQPSFDLMIGEIRLEDGVWIGARAIVCPGVTCRSHAVLTVGSVAAKDMDTYGIYRGNPAVKVKERVMAG